MNWLSLYKQRERFAALVVANLEVPDVTEEAGRDLMVEVKVSRRLAERYVPP